MEKQNPVEVSIICITYNHAKFIGKAIDGFLRQKTNFSYEIIIHDDVSTDGTRDILIEYQRKYPDKIKLLLEEENQYSKDVRILLTLGLPEARGKYVAISDGDDEWIYDGKLQEQYDLLENNPDISFCIHNVIRYNRQTGEKINQIIDMESRILSDEEIIIEPYGRAPTTSFFFRAEYISGIPQFCYRAPVGDNPLRLYYACKGKIYYLNQAWAIRNFLHEGSWNYKMQNESLKVNYVKRYLLFLKEFDEYSKKRFDVYLQKKMYRMCRSAVEVLLPEPVNKDSLAKTINRFGQETENKFGVILKKIYKDRLTQCVDYLDEKTEKFINECKRRRGKLYLYGVGGEARKFAEKLEYMNILFEGFVVSDNHKKDDFFMKHKVSVVSRLDREESYLWLTLNGRNIRQVLPYIEELGFKNILYL